MIGDDDHHKGSFSSTLRGLKDDPVIGEALKRKVEEFQRLNAKEIRRYSRKEIVEMVGTAPPRHYFDECARLWRHALRPHAATEKDDATCETGANQHQKTRKKHARNMKSRRR